VSTPVANLPPAPPPLSGDAQAGPRPDAASLDFAQLLAAQTPLLGSAPDPLSAPPGNPAFDALMSLGGGGGLMGITPLLTLSLIQLLERLLDAELPRQDTPQGLPLSGRISQEFHAGHRALDIAVPVGTPVRATMDGRVVHAGWNAQGYGNLVIVENGPYRTYYAHLDRVPVGVGETVRAGAVVGYSGNTGNSTGPHLHYEVRVDGTPVPIEAQA
jgi:murein DD-endopeptidase MepM/ murein hydrolase activator NlpD